MVNRVAVVNRVGTVLDGDGVGAVVVVVGGVMSMAGSKEGVLLWLGQWWWWFGLAFQGHGERLRQFLPW